VDEDTIRLFRLLRDRFEAIRPSELPGVPIASHDVADLLPCATTAVYFLHSATRGLLYIGRATNLRSRWRLRTKAAKLGGPHLTSKLGAPYAIDWELCHAKLSECIEIGDVTIHWLTVPRELLASAESLLIQIHSPPWNSHRC
jgi:hypothetical protein